MTCIPDFCVLRIPLYVLQRVATCFEKEDDESMMEYAATILRLLLLVISCYGYVRILNRKLPAEFALSVFCTGLCSILFFSGILNILKESAYAIFLIGLVLAAESFRRKESIKTFFSQGIVFFVLAAVILLPILYGRVLADYDDFSHWGTVVKVLYTQDRFPISADKSISYSSYPTGSAAFLYYFLTISGIRAEWFQLYVQAVFMMGMLSSLFVFSKDRTDWTAAMIASVIMLLGNNGPINLLVDTLMPIVVFSGLCICLYYRDSLHQNIFWIIPHLISLVAIKNSGILFAAFLMLFVLSFMGKKGLGRWFAVCSVLPVTLLLWQKHVALVCGSGLDTKHAMSVEHVVKSYLAKNADAYREIATAYIKEVISIRNTALYLLLIILICVVLLKNGKNPGQTLPRKIIGFSVVCYILYIVGMLGMYLSTMPYNEAMRLAGFVRYHRSILIFCGGCLCLAVMMLLSPEKRRHRTRLAVYVLVLMLCSQALHPDIWYNNPKDRSYIRRDLEAYLVSNNVEAGKSYCMVADELYVQYPGYLKMVSRYLLDSTRVLICSIEDYQLRESGWKDYDYLLCFGESEEMRDFLQSTFADSAKRVYAASENAE